MRGRKIVLLAVLLAISAVAVVSFLYPLVPIPVTVEVLKESPGLWVGKRVLVEGKISVGLIWIPEAAPLYNCMLHSAHAYFGVRWKISDYSLDDQDVLVVGVVKYGSGRSYFAVAEYYIDAETLIKISVR